MRMKLLAAATAAVLAALAAPGSALANHSWGGYHWARTANPFTVELDNNLTSAWTSYLSTASSDWAACVRLRSPPTAASWSARATILW